MRLLAACLWLAVGLRGPEALAAPPSPQPETLLFVLPLDPGSDAAAALVYRVFEDVLRQSQGFSFRDAFLAGTAVPDLTAQQLRSLLASARQAYDELELKNAVRLLEQAVQLVEDNPAAAVDGADYREALTLLGASRILLGESARGRSAFLHLLTIDGQARLDPAVFPPALVRSFEEAAATARRLGTGTLDLEPSPPGTEVWVDGTLRGTGPMRLALTEGKHLLRLHRRGCQPFGVRREVIAGAEEVIRQTMAPLPQASEVMSRAAALLSQPDDEFSPPAQELLQRAQAQRMFWFRVGTAGGTLRVAGRLYDRTTRQAVRIPEATLDTGQANWQRQLEALFVSVASDVGGRTIARAERKIPKPQDDATVPAQDRPAPARRPWYATWWFWTTSGALVAGATGLVLGLLLGGGNDAPRSGDVVFRF